jgi:pyrimidine operon attenuation protein/uracil phosphoribosyltransferase
LSPAQRSLSDSATSRVVLDSPDISRALTRIAHEILERNKGSADLILLGIPSRGVPLARRIADIMATVEGRPVASGSLDITMYRDDLRLKPARTLERTEIPASGIDGAIVVLVDDVLFSGRTVRAALDALVDVGRPRAVQLAVLVDRGHRELPIRPDFVGKNLPTSLSETVVVRLVDFDSENDAVLISAQSDAVLTPAQSDAVLTPTQSDAVLTPTQSDAVLMAAPTSAEVAPARDAKADGR